MHIKHLHCMIEELAGGLKENVTACMKPNEVGIIGATVDMLKDLCEAEYYARMAKCLEKDEEEEKEEEKYILRMLKEEHGMSEEDGKRFYDAWRYKSSGRFAPRGKGERYGSRGYEEPPYYHMMPDYRMDLEDYKGKKAEELRDMDRQSRGVMYFSSPMSDGNISRNTADTRNSVSGGNVRGYSDGYADGYSEGERMGKTKGGTSRYDRAKRGYEETKEMHKGNTPQEKQEKMKSLENYMKELAEDVTDIISDATPEERNLLKQKMQVMIQKIG